MPLNKTNVIKTKWLISPYIMGMFCIISVINDTQNLGFDSLNSKMVVFVCLFVVDYVGESP